MVDEPVEDEKSHRMRKIDEGEDYMDSLPLVDRFRLGEPTHKDKPLNRDPFLKSGAEIKELNGTTPSFKRKVTNDLKKFHRGQDGARSKHIDTESIGPYNGYTTFDAVLPPYNLDYLAKLYELSSPHYSAVNAKVSNIVGLGYTLVETPKTQRRLEDLEGQQTKIVAVRKRLMRAKEALLELLEDLNQEDTFTEVLVKVWRDYETTGNGYLEIGRKKDGTVGYVGHVPSTTIRIRRKRDGFVQIVGKDAVFFRHFGDLETGNPFGGDPNPNEIIHIKKYSPSSTYYGVPDIVSASDAIAGNRLSSNFNLDYFENKAVPRHAIISKGVNLGSNTQNALISFFETGLKGQNHRSIYIPLPGDTDKNKVDLKFEAIEAGIQDSSFNNYKKANLNEILMSHRVPISKVGLAEGVSLAVARDADKTFKEQVCAPEQRIFERKINKMISELTDAFRFKLNELTLTDADTQSKIYERAIKNQWMTPNEVRARESMPGLKGGDKVVELKPQQAADARAQGNRARDAQRSAGATDSAGEGRNPKGEGRTTA